LLSGEHISKTVQRGDGECHSTIQQGDDPVIVQQGDGERHKQFDNEQGFLGQGQEAHQVQLNQDAIETIVGLVTERLQSRPVSSSWKYYERAEPTTISTLDDSRLPQNAYETKVIKSDLNDIFDVKKAILKVPKEYRLNATKLLTEIEKRSPQITFDSKGVIFVDGESIPQSNIYKFLPLLYRKKISKTLPGFSDFLTKLNSLGLKQFFLLDKSYKTKLQLHKKLNEELENNSKPSAWWLLK